MFLGRFVATLRSVLFLLATATLQLSPSLFAQQYSIKQYTTDDGLPGRQVMAVFQDKKGYIWVSAGGLAKYNGRNFSSINLPELDDGVFSISEDKQGALWLGSAKGAVRLKDGQAKKWTLCEQEDRFGTFVDSQGRVWIFPYALPGDVFVFERDSLRNFSKAFGVGPLAVLSTVEDDNGAIYLLTRNRRLIRFYANTVREVRAPVLREVRARMALVDSRNRLVFCGHGGAVSTSVVGDDSIKVNEWLSREEIAAGYQSDLGFYWLATVGKGLIRLSRNGETIRIGPDNGLTAREIISVFSPLYEDREHNFWVGSEGEGLFKISNLMFTSFSKNEGFDQSVVTKVAIIDGTIYTAGLDGIRILSGNRFTKLPLVAKGGLPYVYAMAVDGNGALLLGCGFGLYRVQKDNTAMRVGLESSVVLALCTDHMGNVWAGSHNGLFVLQGNQAIIPQDFGIGKKSVSKIIEVKERDLYVGTDSGLVVVNNATNPMGDKPSRCVTVADGLPSNRITELTYLSTRQVLVGTAEGLALVDDTLRVHPVALMRSTSVVAMHEDTRGRIWVGTSKGVFVIQRSQRDFVLAASYTKADGLLSSEMAMNGTIVEGEDGKIWLGMHGGLTVFDPKEELTSSVKPKCYVTAFRVNDTEIPHGGNRVYEFGPGRSDITILCDALSFFNEQQTKLEYYLEPLDKPWSRTTNLAHITYGYLAPDEYTLHVRAVNLFGITSEPEVVNFVVLAPLWKRAWFIVLIGVVLLGAGYKVNHLRLARIRRRNEYLEETVREKTNEILEGKKALEMQYTELLAAQSLLVEKNKLEKAYEEIQVLKERLARENIYLREKQGVVNEVGSVVGRSRALQEVRTRILEVAGTESTVLITGKTGVGKNLVAEAIHGMSPRRDRALVTVNCAAIPDALVESELFGHEKGAFTGATERRIGKFEVADGSTIFLDEIGDMDLNIQAKMLNVLQDRHITRVGGNNQISINVRIIAATNHDLAGLVQQGKFRQDLYYRINVYSIHVPQLHERPEDIEPLTKFFIDRYALKLNKKITAVTKSALSILERYEFPGNIRELENIIHRAVIICKREVISDEDILIQPAPFFTDNNGNGHQSPLVSLEEIERQHIVRVLKETNGKISGSDGAAAILGLHPNTLRSRMEKLKIPFQTAKNT